MDILRKELNEIYQAQGLGGERLAAAEVGAGRAEALTMARVGGGCAVVTDAAEDRCYIYGGRLGRVMGLFPHEGGVAEEASSDEDRIYCRIHPEDLPDKRLLEYELFKHIDALPAQEKLCRVAACRIRMMDGQGAYRYIDNTTRILRLSPAGKIWLILCTYELSANQSPSAGITPAIVDQGTGTVTPLNLGASRDRILSLREKEILRLIRDGLPSKLIADRLGISVNTVNRHRQNIIAKLSVGNSHEAIAAAEAMRLL